MPLVWSAISWAARFELRNLRQNNDRGAPHHGVGTIVKVTNLTKGKPRCAITGRGPFIENRIIDLSMAAAKAIESSAQAWCGAPG
jgi:hypothetical protein